MAFLTWALRRQIFYVGIFIFILAVFGFFIIYPTLNKAPSCQDGRQNGTETGIDCGGSCVNACLAEAEPISILWARSFKVVPGRYNAVAYVVNHNQTLGIQKINYRFRFADANNIYIGKREGSTFIPPGGNFAIFESAIDIGNSIPVYVSFEFTQTPSWLQISQEKINQLKILTSNIELQDEKTAPRLSAVIKNNSLFKISNVGVVAILYDANGNATSASRTYLAELAPLGSADINFTWPEPLRSPVVSKEIIPEFNIFSIKSSQ